MQNATRAMILVTVCAIAAPTMADRQELQKLTASDAAADDEYGRSVAVSGGYAIVGAHLDDDAGGNSGSAYVYRNTGSTWIPDGKLTAGAPDASNADYFGRSVTMDGDYAIVGAYNDTKTIGLPYQSGTAYAFQRVGTPTTGSWVRMDKLEPGDGVNGDCFGFSVAISGQYAICGAYCDDDGGAQSGSAYVFYRDALGTAWTQQGKVTAGDPHGGDYFGYTVAIDGDYAVVGAHGNYWGAAYVFERDGLTWTQRAKLTPSSLVGKGILGVSVAIDGDCVVAGADGAAYVFEKPAGGWADMTETATLNAAGELGSDGFGWAVSIDGDNIVVGAYQEDIDPVALRATGTAYLYQKPGGGWVDMTETVRLIASDAGYVDEFGCSVGISGETAIVGAWANDDAGSNSGSAYLHTVPEPATMGLLGLGLAALALRRRRGR